VIRHKQESSAIIGTHKAQYQTKYNILVDWNRKKS
jgi:hypothetical protein